MVSPLCGAVAGCLTFVIDAVAGSSLLTPIPLLPMYPVYATQHSIVFVDGEAPEALVAYDPTTGERLWTHEGREFQRGYVTGDGTLVVPSLRQTDSGVQFEVERIDPESGASVLVLTRSATEDLALWPEVSSDTRAVIGPGPSIELAPDDSGQLVGSIVDLATGAVDEGAVRLTVTP